MKALVTGASGFIGWHVARTLLQSGIEVKVLRRSTSNPSRVRELGVEETVADLGDVDALRRCLDGCQLLFHVAALYSLRWVDRKDVYRTNVEGTRNLLAAAMKQRVERVVYTSSTATIGLRSDGRPSTEQDVVAPGELVGSYKRSKALAERVAQEYCLAGLDVVVVNPSTPVGWGDVKPTPTGRIVLDFLRGGMPAYVDTGLNFIDVEDVAAGHLLAMERGRTGERYILGNRNMTLAELFGELEEISGVRAPRVRLPHWVALVASVADEFLLSPLFRRPPTAPVAGALMARRKMYFDGGRAVAELGLPQTPLKEALSKAVRWFREGSYLGRRHQLTRESCS